MMLKLVAFIFIAGCLTARSGTVHVAYSFADFTTHPLNVARVTVTPLARGADYSGAQLSAAPLIYTKAAYPTLTNGTLTVSNLVAGYAYRVEFSDGYGAPAITNYFASGLSGNIDGSTNKGVIISQTGGVVFQFAYYYQYPTNFSLSPWASDINAAGYALTNAGSITSTGTVTAASFVGDGSQVTSVNGTNITDGTISSNKLNFAIGGQTNWPIAAITNWSASNNYVGSFTGDGSGLTNLPAQPQTPWASDIDAAQFGLTNVGTLRATNVVSSSGLTAFYSPELTFADGGANWGGVATGYGPDSTNVTISARNGAFAGGSFLGANLAIIDSGYGSFAGMKGTDAENVRLRQVAQSLVSLNVSHRTNVDIIAARSVLVGYPPNSYTADFESTVAVIGTNGDLTGFSTNGFFGNGSGLTNIPVAAISDLPNFQLANVALSNVISGASNSYTGSFTGNGAGLTNLTLDAAQTNWPVSAITNFPSYGSAAYSNSAAFDPSGVALAATNKLNTDLRAALAQTNISVAAITNFPSYGTAAYSNSAAFDLSGVALAATNKLNTDLRASLAQTNISVAAITNFPSYGTAAYSNSVAFQNASVVLSNVVSGSSNSYTGSFTGNGAGLTNIVGTGGGDIYAASNNVFTGLTNHFTMDVGIAGTFGVNTGTVILLTAGTVSGNGSGLTNLSVPLALTNNDSRSVTLTGSFTGNGAGLTNLSGIGDVGAASNNVFTGLTNHFVNNLGVGGTFGVVTGTMSILNVSSIVGNGAGLTNLSVPLALTNNDTRAVAFVGGLSATGNVVTLAAGSAGTLVVTNGNVGIGTTSPGKKLQISDNSATISLAGASEIGSTFGGLWINASTPSALNYSLIGNGTDFYINRSTGGDIHFRQNNSASDQMVIKTTTGNVGLSTTTPTHTLDVNGSFSVTNASTALFNGDVALVGSGSDLSVGGNVGIGTTAPGRILHVEGTGGLTAIRITDLTGSTALELIAANSASTKRWFVQAEATGLFSIQNGAFDPAAFVITQAGNVGIGTLTPASKLDVSGAIHSGITNTTTPALVSLGTNNAVLRCPNGGSFLLRIDNAGVISTVTNTAGL